MICKPPIRVWGKTLLVLTFKQKKEFNIKTNPITITSAAEKQHAEFIHHAMTGTIRDNKNPAFIFQMTDTSVLIDAIENKFDLYQSALIELAARGYVFNRENKDGK